MTPMHVGCWDCGGAGLATPTARSPWPLCPACDGLGYVFAPGAPGYGCDIELGERVPGEVVTLGNGDHGRVLRHSPTGTPMSWLGPIGLFTGIESHSPIAYPSSAGVAEVHVSRVRTRADRGRHPNARAVDVGDPLQRQLQYLRGA